MTDDLWHRDGPWAPLARDRAGRSSAGWVGVLVALVWTTVYLTVAAAEPALGPEGLTPAAREQIAIGLVLATALPVAVVVTLLGVRGVRRGAVRGRVIGWFALVLGGVALLPALVVSVLGVAASWLATGVHVS